MKTAKGRKVVQYVWIFTGMVKLTMIHIETKDAKNIISIVQTEAEIDEVVHVHGNETGDPDPDLVLEIDEEEIGPGIDPRDEIGIETGIETAIGIAIETVIEIVTVIGVIVHLTGNSTFFKEARDYRF